MHEIKESDWKIFRQLRPPALERLCKRILSEIERVSADGSKGYHERYLEIFRVLRQRDREVAEAFDGPRRSRALTQIASIKQLGLLTDDESLRFSQETRDAVNLMLEVRQ
jgi:hypothetical protein